LGYERPVEDELVVRLAYSSQLVRIPPGMVNELIMLVGPMPGRPTGMGLFAYEDDVRMLTVFGLAGVEPPNELPGMLDFIADFAPAHVLAALRQGELLGDPARYRIPSNRWRRYDQMRHFPTGLLVFGDAICSFNPIYGQGMTVAILQALELEKCLRRGTDDLASRFFRAASKPIGVAWQLAVGGDLNLPEIEGPRSLSVRLVNSYVDKVQAAAGRDIVVAEKFVRVAGFRAPPGSLMHPAVMSRVAAANWRRTRSHVDVAPSFTKTP
ncbi:MAG: 2-polyprenyl-6-methoxyphenol hydroxylase-like oxidoreductase, partial [Mycobacterium sp.]|nr:2-polyprenyl-6-methoxyphenol hydroxylase-like oxidoreductase [Mycobacterium sp.]